ncbi:MAG: glyoxylase-like metal-dependent hydrolase (beta-lactamase superfamily II) [Gammaproteobacteria bacterium]|jgi:glyoxylase-like metal-dependent hydrolase (beta-lactamase superfamily II)
MADWRTIDKDVIHIDTQYVRSNLASNYLIGSNGEYAVIETGTCHTVPEVLSTMADLKIDPGQIKYVIPTHIHLDHVGGAGLMMENFKEASLVIHPRGARHVINPEKLIAGSIAVYGESKFHELYGELKPIDEQRVIVADDLHRLSLGSRELLFLDTPGHARHHFCIYDELTRGFFTGDTFGLCYPELKHHPHGLIPTSSPIHFDPDAMFKSIDRLLDYKPKTMYLTHFDTIDNPQKRSDSLRSWINNYLDICEKINPQNHEDSPRVEQEIWNLTRGKFDDSGVSPSSLERTLSLDLRLSAQGLVHWWINQDAA